MIECIFTLDYELYGNGEGSLDKLVYQPTERLVRIFKSAGAKFVCFVEAAELEVIGNHQSDPAIHDVRRQIVELHRRGHEIALHLHPQWYNARFDNGRWLLDEAEYNLCVLPKERIVQIVDRAVLYLATVLDNPDFRPISFRAGNWLFQPTKDAASVLTDYGIKIDSSVFKGGRQRKHHLDYLKACHNGPFWRFQDDVNQPDPGGPLLEVPIYTDQVPFWRMVTKKRLDLQQKGGGAGKGVRQKLSRLRDFMRFRHPLKFDFCRMTLDELISMTDHLIRLDMADPSRFRPMVAIGHTKDLTDFETVHSYLSYLRYRGIAVSTFEDIYRRCEADQPQGRSVANGYESETHPH